VKFNYCSSAESETKNGSKVLKNASQIKDHIMQCLSVVSISQIKDWMRQKFEFEKCLIFNSCNLHNLRFLPNSVKVESILSVMLFQQESGLCSTERSKDNQYLIFDLINIILRSKG